MLDATLTKALAKETSRLQLTDGSRVAVVGGGPAGSFFAYFFQQFAERVGLEAEIDIYERKDFCNLGPKGCNHCGGIISESLVQLLAADGIHIPPTVVQRGIESYVLHTDVGSVRIDTPTLEKRIAAIYRGSGPIGAQDTDWESFDHFLQDLAVKSGAKLINAQVAELVDTRSGIQLLARDGSRGSYDLVVGAVGVNTPSLRVFEGIGLGYEPPGTTKTYICEFRLGREVIKKHFRNSMHVFLLDIPRLKFAALIPKSQYVTMCLLGEDIDKQLVEEFLSAPEVIARFPPGFELTTGRACQCSPKINVVPAGTPYADRMVLVGDSAVTRLYKDGIGAAYRTAKAAASTAVLHGVAGKDFADHYWPVCTSINKDNALGKKIFALSKQVQKRAFTKRGLLRMVEREQTHEGCPPRMSGVLWDTFTGSASYGDICRRAFKPAFVAQLAMATAKGLVSTGGSPAGKEA